MTTKEVCEPCNNGWMQKIEDAAKDVTQHMLLGGGRELHSKGQATIAAWGVLKAFVVHQTFPRALVPPEHYREVYESRENANATLHDARLYRTGGVEGGADEKPGNDGRLLSARRHPAERPRPSRDSPKGISS
jgi:hypothetical protein